MICVLSCPEFAGHGSMVFGHFLAFGAEIVFQRTYLHAQGIHERLPGTRVVRRAIPAFPFGFFASAASFFEELERGFARHPERIATAPLAVIECLAEGSHQLRRKTREVLHCALLSYWLPCGTDVPHPVRHFPDAPLHAREMTRSGHIKPPVLRPST
jgi:hypothetical protein